MKTFYSHGKLLLTGEYIVLDGAKALALPTIFGQSLSIKKINSPKINWKSFDDNNIIWFEGSFTLDTRTVNILPNESNETYDRLIQILMAAKKLNSNFLKSGGGYDVISKLEFPRSWGLGSSSTLINNIANWANVNPFELSDHTLGGSGYDIACAQYNHPITYLNNLDNTKEINSVNFNPSFKNQLFFIHLNQKQDSREGIKHYSANKNNLSTVRAEINSITESIIICKTISEFSKLIEKHEQIISKLVNLPTIKSTLFHDYSGAIKSLGAWGGDFILATGNLNDMGYFKKKGYNTILPFEKMIA